MKSFRPLRQRLLQEVRLSPQPRQCEPLHRFVRLSAVSEEITRTPPAPGIARALSAVSDPDGHRSRRAPALGSREAGADAPNMVWELDSTPADVMCSDGRHTLVGVIDVWPRRGRVLVVPTSRATAICALLRTCVIDWGVPETVRTDEGRDYTSRHLSRVLADLGVDHDICPPYTPEAKPFIERFFGTMTRDLFAYLPGFTGHNVADRKRLEAKKSFAARRGEGDRETFNISLTAAALQEKCDIWCEAVYGRRSHSGTGESPFARVAGWTAPLRRIADERALDALLAEPIGGGGLRTIGKSGIPVGGRHYIAPEFGSRIKERVEVRMDPGDPAHLFVFGLDGTFLCMAVDPDRIGVDRAAIAAKAKADARTQDSAARKRARDLGQDHAPDRAMDEVLEAAGRDAGKVVALPQGGVRHETPALEQSGKATAAAQAGRQPATRTGPPAPFSDVLKKLYLQKGD